MTAQSVVPTAMDRSAAFEWLARRDADSPADVELAFQLWLAERPHHRAAYEEAAQLWSLLGEPARRVAACPDCRKPPARRVARLVLPTALAACLMIVAATGLWLFDPAFVKDWRADVATARGESRVHVLPDGSSVTLGPDTALALDFSQPRGRHVELLRGEAFFAVRPAAGSRFTVAAGAGRVEVTGTAFAVDRHGEDLAVTVQSGSVKVSVGRDDVALAASQRLLVEAGRAGAVETVDTDLELGWMQGHLAFDRQPLSRIAAILQRYMPVRVVTRGDAANRLVSGSFPTDRPEEALRAAVATAGARLQFVSPWLVVIF